MRRGKNYLLTLLIVVLLWTTFGLLIFLVEPEMVKDILVKGIYLPFFLNLYLALFFTLAVIFGSSWRGFLAASAIISFLVLRLSGLGSWLNLLLIFAISFTLDRHFTKKGDYDKKT